MSSTSSSQYPLLERSVETDALAEVVSEGLAGAGRVAVIEGEAGIGKSRLLEGTARAAAEAGALVFRARGAQLEREYGWGVMRQLFERWLHRCEPRERAALTGGAAAVVEATLPHESTVVDQIEPFSAVHGAYWFTVNLSSSRSVLLLIDDAQWADEASLRWLSYLAPRTSGLSLAIVFAVRRPDSDADREPLLQIASDTNVQLVRPRGLSLAATTELLSARTGLEGGHGLAEAVHEVTAGNPFMLSALLDELAELTTAGPPDVVAVRSIRPEAIKRSIVARLARLPLHVQDLARALTVLGGSATLQRAASLAGCDETDAAQGISTLRQAGILRDGPPIAFAHPIVENVIGRDLGGVERAVLHARAAAILERSSAGIQDIAAQLLHTSPSADQHVVDRLEEAARAAFSRGAPEEAAVFLRRASEEPPEPDREAGTLLLLGRAETLAWGAAGIGALRAAHQAMTGTDRRPEIALELARALEGLSRNLEAVQVYTDALQAPVSPSVRGELEGGLVVAAAQHLSTMPIAGNLLAAFSERFSSMREEDRIHRVVFALAMTSAGGRDGVDLAARELGRGWLYDAEPSLVIGLAVAPLVWDDRLDEALVAWDEVVQRARRSGRPFRLALGLTFRAQVYLRAGRLPEAEDDVRAALRIPAETWGETPIPVDTPAILAETLIERGRLDAADDLLRPHGEADGLSDYQGNNLLLLARGRLRLAQGRTAEAAEDLLELGRRCEAWGLRNPAAIPWRSHAALALRATDHPRAQQLVDEEVELARAFGAPRALGISLRIAGLTAGGTAGLERLEEAAAVLENSPALLERARALVALGSAERRAGRRARAGTALLAGLDAASACAADALARVARDELNTIGARPRRDRTTGRDALTASESRVARLAADGRTNREIAEALWVTLRTVETHLTRTYSKLGISSRTELRAALAS